MTTTPTDDLPKLLGSLIREAFTARGFNGKDDDLLDLSALIERTASALADRQARAAQAEPPLTESERAVDAPVTPSDYMAGGANVQHRQREAEAAGQEARESDLRVRVREGDARQRGSQQPSEGVPAAQVERPADAPQPAAVVLNPATGDVRFEPEQQSTAQPVAEAYQRGIVQGMNDVLHNGIDWARAKFGGAPLTASKPSEPAQDEALKVARPAVTRAMVTAYLKANDEYWRRVDGEPMKLGRWRNGTPSEAVEYSLIAALAQIDALEKPSASAQPASAFEPLTASERSRLGLPPESL